MTKYVKADKLLHKAIDVSQSVIFELELLGPRSPDSEFNASIRKLEKRMHKQAKLITNARRELWASAPADSASRLDQEN